MEFARKTSRYVALAVLTVSAYSQQYPAPPCDRTIAEETLRKTFAVKIVDPIYPSEAIRQQTTGLVVAELCVAAGSQTASVRIATAPSEAVAKSVKMALSEWRFGPMWLKGRPNEHLSYASKVTYYFVKKDAQWLVRGPMESFYVGPKFVLRQQLSR
ncbi:MAG: hypothetical protein ACM3S5_06985 [Rhodospirillales bacterium]